MSTNRQNRTYTRRDCAVFRKTEEAFGGLSNMAPGYPVRVNGVRVMTIEALYQASRFPHLPEVQRLIIDQHSPMTAKMVSKPHRKDSRADWDKVRITVMRWCLRLKLSQHWTKFSQLLLSTGDRAIVEDSKRDDFWGAIPSEGETLVGLNVLGRLLMELREEIKKGAELRRVEASAIDNFLLFGDPLQVVDFRADKNAPTLETKYPTDAHLDDLALPLFSAPSSLNEFSKTRSEPAMPPKPSGGLIEGLQPHSEYIESAVPWLGSVPLGWRVERTKRVFRKRKELNLGRKCTNVLSLTLRGVVNNDPDSPEGLVPKDYATYQLFRKNDLVFKLIDLENLRTSRVGLVHEDGIMSSAYLRLIPSAACNVRFYYHQFFDLYSRAVFNALGAGVRSTLGAEDLGEIRILIPPPDEQAAIVRFLEHANRKIDGFIRAKRKLIGLLIEQKQTIIHRAVTRGVDPHANLAPSGIPWLDCVPSHWPMHPNRSLFRIRKRIVGARHREFQVLSLTKRGVIVRDMDAGGKFSSFWERSQEVRPGNMVFCFFDVDETPRGVGLSRVPGMISPDYTVMECPAEPVASFLELFYIAMDDHKMLKPLYTGLRKRVSKPLFLAAKTPIPPDGELRAIVEHVKGETKGIDVAIARTEREIALMLEFRTRLTADVVTGKFDVRVAAAQLPDISAQPDSEAAKVGDLAEVESEEVEA